ncbi:hypothetical protein MAPG_04329 [Magnaporthiopsis poae ATCC 64411]|uniref:Pyrroloquinoline quinone-dependent pyranose dehydrogenase beta-propeller domain-containing protein n=1 Tax=Magnaporthiopsis poae (strain ATCC 64411 / 73-15) TaxID=644358 RepID=A0A0C4DWF3_MAGP6|nr:hypothetical protein MAPG_04329 [Magnaporthiopsis poae ATCC 64411]
MHLLSSAALVWLLVQGATAQNCQAVTGRFQPKVGQGYRVNAIATGLRSPRHIVVDTAGNLLVAESGVGSVKRLVLTENNGNVCVKSSSSITPAQSTNHGIALSADGKTLFTSNLNNVYAFPYNAETGAVGTSKTIITGMSNGGTHPTRAIFASKASPDTILVARGANNNIDTTTQQQSTGRGIIKSFSISATSSSPAQYASQGQVLGWGLRNIVGMGEHPGDGGVWSVENSLDDTRLNGRDVHNENPAEKLNFHGMLNNTNNPRKGLNFGYPSCFPAWDTQLLGISGIKVGDLFMPDSVPRASDCASRATGASQLRPGNAVCPNIKRRESLALVAFHGSWNRRPADGYRVMRVDFGSDGQPVASPQSTTASIPVMENTNLGACPGACFRPVGLDFDQKGRLFVSSDSSGEIYVIYGA